MTHAMLSTDPRYDNDKEKYTHKDTHKDTYKDEDARDSSVPV